jgi:hypothetical protein
MRLTLRGLKPDTWYLVTVQDPTGHKQFSAHGARCLFGVKNLSGGFEFCDIALVQTNPKGKVFTRIPTEAGLIGDPSPTCTEGNVPNLIADPDLGHGFYTGLTMVVKKVGASLDGTTPDCGSLSTGGIPELFERGPLPDFDARN